MEEFSTAGWADGNFKSNNTGQLIVLFHPFQKFMQKESELRGRPVHKEVVYITKIVPGDKGHVIDRPMREQDMAEFPHQWAAYQNKLQNKIIGIPIEHWPALSDTQKADFKHMNIQTIEQFAQLSDGIGAKIMGFNDLRAKALAYIEAGKNDQLLADVKAGYEARAIEQDKQISELRAMLEKLSDKDAKKKAS